MPNEPEASDNTEGAPNPASQETKKRAGAVVTSRYPPPSRLRQPGQSAVDPVLAKREARWRDGSPTSIPIQSSGPLSR